MIHGIGTDIVIIQRLTSLIERYGLRVGDKILAHCEKQDYLSSQNPARFLAKRFAAKEAVAKALGTGLRGAITMPSFWVEHSALGKPFVDGNATFKAYLNQQNITLHLSISDEETLATAYAIAEYRPSSTLKIN